MKSYKDDILYHHGILGMKWGVRRYQNRDGTLTAAGRKHRQKLEGSSIDNKFKAREHEVKNEIKAFSDETKDLIPFSSGSDPYNGRKYDAEMRHRVTQAADLGLKVLVNRGSIDSDAVGNNDWRWWFINEDQTFGLGMIADMINRGYSAKQCEAIIRKAEALERKRLDVEREVYKKDHNSKYSLAPNAHYRGVMFDIGEGNYKDELVYFARECEKEKRKS